MTPRVLEGVVIDQHARVAHCKVCGAAIWWGYTREKKRNPFDVQYQPSDAGDWDYPIRTAITHFSTCPEVRQFEKGRGRV